MSKIIINERINSSNVEENINNKKAILKDNKISYDRNGFIMNIIYEDEKIFITRENDDVKIDLEFKKDQSLITKYHIKDINTIIKLETITKELSILDNRIYIKYDLYMNEEFSDSFEFELEWRDL